MSSDRRTIRGFSLIELIVVIVIMSVLAVAAVPAIGIARESAQLAARDEVTRQLGLARATAIQTGSAVGVRFDLDTQVLSLLTVASAGEPAVSLAGPLGVVYEPTNLTTTFRGVTITSIADGEGTVHVAGEDAMLWFGFDGVPERRDAEGALLGVAEQSARIESSAGWAIVVHAASGMIE